MFSFRLVAVFAGLLALSACGVVEVPTRAAPPAPALADIPPIAETAPRPAVSLAQVQVRVPETLRVSEANVYYPIADIVWRGEARGDRHAQVQAIFAEAAALPAPAAPGAPEVALEIEVARFHALTEKARYTIGGVHSIRFTMTLRDVATGAVIDGPRLVSADLRAAGGAAALEQEARGLTQRVMIVDHLARVLAQELAAPSAGAVPVAATNPVPSLALAGSSRRDFRPADLLLR